MQKADQDGMVEYTLQAEDMVWLEEFNKKNRTLSLSMMEMESIMDRLEKNSFYHLNTHRIALNRQRKRRRSSTSTSLPPSPLTPSIPSTPMRVHNGVSKAPSPAISLKNYGSDHDIIHKNTSQEFKLPCNIYVTHEKVKGVMAHC